MPIEIDFTARKKTIKRNSPELYKVIQNMLAIPSILHQGVEVTTIVDREDGYVKKLTFSYTSLTVADNESLHMFESVIEDHLEDLDAPFYHSATRVYTKVPGEFCFTHTRLRPFKSRNAKELSKVQKLDIPEKFCCPLSGDIIDQPVYDVRSPEVVYDYDFLMYWLNKSFPKLMPDTKLAYSRGFLKINYDLKVEIDAYVGQVLDKNNNDKLKELFSKYKCDDKNQSGNINEALLQLSGYEDNEAQNDELSLLLQAGAEINYQDQVKKETALHRALRKGSYTHALSLIYAGAHIVIKDSENITAFDLINAVQNPGSKKTLLFVCQTLQLITLTPCRWLPNAA